MANFSCVQCKNCLISHVARVVGQKRVFVKLFRSIRGKYSRKVFLEGLIGTELTCIVPGYRTTEHGMDPYLSCSTDEKNVACEHTIDLIIIWVHADVSEMCGILLACERRCSLSESPS